MLNARFYTVQYCLNGDGCLHIILGSGYTCLHLLYVWRIKYTFWYQIHIMRYQIYGHLVQSCFQDLYIPVLHYSSFVLLEAHTFTSWVAGFIFCFVSFSFLYCVSLHTGYAVLYTLVFAGWRSAIHASKNSCLLIAVSYIFLHTLRSLIPAA